MRWLTLIPYLVAAAAIIGAYVYGYRCGHHDGRKEILDQVEAWREAEAVAEECRLCGCTEYEACAGGCWWVVDPCGRGPLCSACLPAALAQAEGITA